MTERNMKEELQAKAYKRKTSLRDCFSRLPNILVVSLRRFELDFETFETVKRNDVMEFPQILNIEKYTHDHFKKEEKIKQTQLNSLQEGPEASIINGAVAPLYETKNETKNDTNNDTSNETKGDQTVPPPSSLIHTISGALKSKKNNNGK